MKLLFLIIIVGHVLQGVRACPFRSRPHRRLRVTYLHIIAHPVQDCKRTYRCSAVQKQSLFVGVYAGKNIAKNVFVRGICVFCAAYISQLHRATTSTAPAGVNACRSTRDVCSNGKAPRADMESAPHGAGKAMLVIPNKSLNQQKIPEQTFEDLCLDVTKKIPCLKIHPIFCLLF